MYLIRGERGLRPQGEHAGGGPGIGTLLRLYPQWGLSIAVLGNMNGWGLGKVAEYAIALLAKEE